MLDQHPPGPNIDPSESSTDYRPSPWIRNGHLLTIWGRLFRKATDLPLVRETWETPDDDELDVLRYPGTSATAPSFVLFHGLEGSERSHYVRGMLREAASRGWHSNLLLFRTCNGRLNRQSRSYHSGETSDIRFVIERLLKERPDAPLVACGVSLGGNALLKFLGEQGDAVDRRILAATAVSVPFDLAKSAQRIGEGFSKLYSWNFLRSLKPKALAKIEQHPGIADPARVLAVRTLREFDDVFTSIVHGFRNAADYYARSSSLQFLSRIRTPTLLLSAKDDPFHPPGLTEEVARVAAGNSSLTVEFTERGGHVGFLEGATPWSARSYVERRPVEFAASVLRTGG